MEIEERHKILGELYIKYPELLRIQKMVVPLMAITMLKSDTEFWVEELEAILQGKKGKLKW